MNACILAIDAGGTSLKCGLFREGRLVDGSLDRQPVDSNAPDAAVVHEAYRTLLRRQTAFAATRGYEIGRVGVDTPGPFDYETGTSLMAHKYTAIKGISLIPWICEVTGNIPVRFIHDSEAFILGTADQFPRCTRICGVMVGTGLGFATLLDGKPQRNTIGGPKYSVYQQPYRGATAEEYVSARGIVTRYNATASTPAPDAKAVEARARVGDPVARQVYAETGTMLAEIIAPILLPLGIEALAVGGQIARSFARFENELHRGLAPVKTLRHIASARDIDLAHLIGAAQATANERQNDKNTS